MRHLSIIDGDVQQATGGTVLGRVVNPHTFDGLETITAPFDGSILVLTRPPYTNVQPGDYGYMIDDGAV